jgi:hypothetical protein
VIWRAAVDRVRGVRLAHSVPNYGLKITAVGRSPKPCRAGSNPAARAKILDARELPKIIPTQRRLKGVATAAKAAQQPAGLTGSSKLQGQPGGPA